MYLQNVEKAGKTVEEVRNELFKVVEVPMHTGMPDFNIPDSEKCYFTNDGKFLGIHKDRFKPIQPETILNSIDFLDNLNFQTYDDCKKVKFSSFVKTTGFKNAAKLNDEVAWSIDVSTSYDGSRPLTIGLFTHRLVCENGMIAKGTEKKVSYKNTKNNVGKFIMLAKDLEKTAANIEGMSQLFEAYDKKAIKAADVKKFLNKLYSIKAGEEPSTRLSNVLDRINESIAIETQRSGGTLWGLLNGVTHYTNHIAPKQGDDGSYINFATGRTLNNKAQELIYAML